MVRPPILKAESLYSQETVPNTACCKKLHKYSNAPPINMLAKKIMLSFCLYSRERISVITTAPMPYTGMKGPNTNPTRTSKWEVVTKA